VTLNVGGKHLTTTKTTLAQAKGSMLERMFSNEWNKDLAVDKDGAILIDCDHRYFRFNQKLHDRCHLQVIQ